MPTRILVIDDEPESVKEEVVVCVASDPNYEILTETGASISSVLSHLPSVDIVLLDFRFDLPGQSIDGLSILRQVRANRDGRDIPVILLSRVDDLGGEHVWREFTQSLQVADFVAKSTPPEVIKYKIDREVRAARP